MTNTPFTEINSNFDPALALLAECWASGIWLGYGDLVAEPIELPGWCRD